MFNTLFEKPKTVTGFNSLILKKESKRKYLYANGNEIEPISLSAPYGSYLYSEDQDRINIGALSTVLDTLNTASFSTTSKISLVGFSRIWFELLGQVETSYYRSGLTLFVDDTLNYAYDIPNTTNPDVYVRYTSGFSRLFVSLDIRSLDKTKTYYVGVGTEAWDSSGNNIARVYQIYLER